MPSQYLWKALQRQKPSAACGVGKEIVTIYRCNETRQVWIFLHILVVGHAVLDHRAGDEVVQFVLVTLVEGFELVVNVYDEVLPYIGKRVLLLRIYLSRIAVTMQGRRTEQVKERGLELALLASQYKAGVITALTVVHGVGDHCHEPFSKVRQPFVRITDNYATCQFGNDFQ